jgi:hypothetical protein
MQKQVKLVECIRNVVIDKDNVLGPNYYCVTHAGRKGTHKRHQTELTDFSMFTSSPIFRSSAIIVGAAIANSGKDPTGEMSSMIAWLVLPI